MPLDKKQLERHALERFKAIVSDFPEGEITDSEEPDFIVTTPEFNLGIELTTLHVPAGPNRPPPQASEAMRWRVFERAKTLYDGARHPPVSCSVHMRDGHIQRDEVESLAQAIVEIIVKNLPEIGKSIRIESDWFDDDRLPDTLLSVMVHRPAGITESFFQCPGAIWVPPLAASDLNRVIASKENKYPAYRRRCDAVWLLISADTTTMATWFQFDDALFDTPVSSQFQRIFLMRHIGDKVHELLIAPNGTSPL